MNMNLRGMIAKAACLGLLVSLSSVADAAVRISIPNTLGATGDFEVLLTNPDAVPVEIGGFTLNLEGLGLNFTGVATGPTVAPYLFAGESAVELVPIDFSNDPFPGMAFSATDFTFSSLSVTVNPGEVFALARVTFDLPANSDPDALLPVRFGPLMDLVDGDLNRVPFTTAGGAPVPEPGSLAIASLLCLAGGTAVWFRRRNRR